MSYEEQPLYPFAIDLVNSYYGPLLSQFSYGIGEASLSNFNLPQHVYYNNFHGTSDKIRLQSYSGSSNCQPLYPYTTSNSLNKESYSRLYIDIKEEKIINDSSINPYASPESARFTQNPNDQQELSNNFENLKISSLSSSNQNLLDKSNKYKPAMLKNIQTPINPKEIIHFSNRLSSDSCSQYQPSKKNPNQIKPADDFNFKTDKFEDLLTKYNPKIFNTSPQKARFFVIKSFSEDDVHRSIKYSIWCSTENGNRKLDSAYKEASKNNTMVYLFFSVNQSGHFCGMAEMISHVDYQAKAGVWTQDNWRGKFNVRWIFIKDVPNSVLKNIKVQTNDNKPVTYSRDATEIPFDQGKTMLHIFFTYKSRTCLLEDFEMYDQEEMKLRESCLKRTQY